MPEHYKLTYFNARGRAEVIRLIFALAGVEYEDCRFERAEWQAIKDKTPYGQAPTLEVDGKVLCQSHAIERYLAKKFGLAGRTEWDHARLDMIIECMEDYLRAVVPMFQEDNEDKKKAKAEKLLKEQIPQFLTNLEKMRAENGHQGFFVGNELTAADLIFYHMTAQIVFMMKQDTPESWDKYPGLKAVREAVEQNPRIQAWIAKRPVTER